MKRKNEFDLVSKLFGVGAVMFLLLLGGLFLNGDNFGTWGWGFFLAGLFLLVTFEQFQEEHPFSMRQTNAEVGLSYQIFFFFVPLALLAWIAWWGAPVEVKNFVEGIGKLSFYVFGFLFGATVLVGVPWVIADSIKENGKKKNELSDNVVGVHEGEFVTKDDYERLSNEERREVKNFTNRR